MVGSLVVFTLVYLVIATRQLHFIGLDRPAAAHGEANEVKSSLDLALAWGYVADDAAARAKLRRLLALCWGLTHGTYTATRSRT